MRQHEVWPQVDEVIEDDVEANVLIGALTEHLLVHPRAVVAVREVVAPRWSAPTHPKRELDQAGCLGDAGRVNILRDRNRARPGSKR